MKCEWCSEEIKDNLAYETAWGFFCKSQCSEAFWNEYSEPMEVKYE